MLRADPRLSAEARSPPKRRQAKRIHRNGSSSKSGERVIGPARSARRRGPHPKRRVSDPLGRGAQRPRRAVAASARRALIPTLLTASVDTCLGVARASSCQRRQSRNAREACNAIASPPRRSSMRLVLAKRPNPASSRAATPPPALSLPVSDNLGSAAASRSTAPLVLERSPGRRQRPRRSRAPDRISGAASTSRSVLPRDGMSPNQPPVPASPRRESDRGPHRSSDAGRWRSGVWRHSQIRTRRTEVLRAR